MFDWRRSPQNHQLDWWRKDDQKRTEEKNTEIKATLNQTEEIDWVTSGQSLERPEEEIIAELEEDIEQGSQGRDFRRDLLRESSAEADKRIENEGWMTAEEAVAVDGFHYVHSQVWYPIIEEIHDVDESIQEISERSLESDHAADAYGIERESYDEITEELENPLRKFIAAGEYNSDNPVRQQVEEELTSELERFMDSESAEEFTEDLDKNLYWKTQDEYSREDLEDIKEEIEDEDALSTIEQQVERITIGKPINEAEVEQVLDESQSSEVLDQLREMQSSLQDKSRGRLISALSDPEKTPKQSQEYFESVLADTYTKEWKYSLAINWDKAGNPPLEDRETVHSKYGRIANTVHSFINGKRIFSKDFLETVDEIDIDTVIGDFNYWSGDSSPITIKNPEIPVEDDQIVRLHASLIEGRTKEQGDTLKFQYMKNKNSETRFRAFERLNGFGDFVSFTGREGEYGNADSERVTIGMPGFLTDLADGDELAGMLQEPELAAEYVTQAIYERGNRAQIYESSRGVEIGLREEELFEEALDTLGLERGENYEIRDKGEDYNKNYLHIYEGTMDNLPENMDSELEEFFSTTDKSQAVS